MELSQNSMNRIVVDSGGVGFLPELLQEVTDLILNNPNLVVEHLFLERDEFGERIVLYTVYKAEGVQNVARDWSK